MMATPTKPAEAPPPPPLALQPVVTGFVDTGAGVIDSDYRGEVKVLLFNHEDKEFAVKAGDRVAQLILERIATPEVVAVDDLDATDRQAGGFGSTGVAAPVKPPSPTVPEATAATTATAE